MHFFLQESNEWPTRFLNQCKYFVFGVGVTLKGFFLPSNNVIVDNVVTLPDSSFKNKENDKPNF